MPYVWRLSCTFYFGISHQRSTHFIQSSEFRMVNAVDDWIRVTGRFYEDLQPVIIHWICNDSRFLPNVWYYKIHIKRKYYHNHPVQSWKMAGLLSHLGCFTFVQIFKIWDPIHEENSISRWNKISEFEFSLKLFCFVLIYNIFYYLPCLFHAIFIIFQEVRVMFLFSCIQ